MMLSGHSEVSLAAAILCHLQLCIVLGGCASKLPGLCCIPDIDMVSRQTSCIVQCTISQDDHHVLSVWHTLFKGCFSLCYCQCLHLYCSYTDDLYFCLLQAACIEVLDHFVVDISLRCSVYLNEVEEKKSVMHGHWFALVFGKRSVSVNL